MLLSSCVYAVYVSVIVCNVAVSECHPIVVKYCNVTAHLIVVKCCNVAASKCHPAVLKCCNAAAAICVLSLCICLLLYVMLLLVNATTTVLLLLCANAATVVPLGMTCCFIGCCKWFQYHS